MEWPALVIEQLRDAARLAGEHGGVLEQFMAAAYGTFLEVNPAARIRLAELKLVADIEALRSAGRVGQA
jgi:hypothetical protein